MYTKLKAYICTVECLRTLLFTAFTSSCFICISSSQGLRCCCELKLRCTQKHPSQKYTSKLLSKSTSRSKLDSPSCLYEISHPHAAASGKCGKNLSPVIFLTIFDYDLLFSREFNIHRERSFGELGEVQDLRTGFGMTL